MSEQVVGIDLGTTFSALATINPSGKAEIVPNAEGDRITASAVYFDANGTVTVGQLAVEQSAAYPDRVVRWAKRNMGEASWRKMIDGKAYSAIDISSLILRKVAQDAQSSLGPIKHAVITVPAYFDETRRRATIQAAEQAGLSVLRIINEPTAAALAYAAGGLIKGRVLVYDFGGGTFDVSIVDIASPRDVKVVTSEGDHRLGGIDLDKKLANHFNEVFKREKGISLYDGTLHEDHLPAEMGEAIIKAEATKRALSTMTEKTVQLVRGGHSVAKTIPRKEFEQLIAEYIVRTDMLIDSALHGARCTPKDIDAVLLVGGSTRIPAVTALLKYKFGKDPIKTVNPDEAVALGAAIQAGMIGAERGLISLPPAAMAALKETKLADVTNHSYGVISVADAYGVQQLRNTPLLKKNTPIPCEHTESFYTMSQNQTGANCRITQGEGSDPEFVRIVAEGEMQLPPNRPANCEIKVTYSYDRNGCMSAKFLDVQSGNELPFVVSAGDLKGAPPKAQVEGGDDLDDLVIN